MLYKKLSSNHRILQRQTGFPQRVGSVEEKKKRSKVLWSYSKSLENSTCSSFHDSITGRVLGHTTEVLWSIKQIFFSEINLNFFPCLLLLTVKILVLEAGGAAARLGWMKPPGEEDITQAPAVPVGVLVCPAPAAQSCIPSVLTKPKWSCTQIPMS